MKLKGIALLAALAVVAIGIVVVCRPGTPPLTLHYMGKDHLLTSTFILTNSSPRAFNCSDLYILDQTGVSRRVAFNPPPHRVAPHGSAQFQFKGPFVPGSDDAFVLCATDRDLIFKARQWLRRLGLPVSAKPHALKVGMKGSEEIVGR